MDFADLKIRTKDILLNNLVEGHSKYLNKDYCYIKPSKEKYPFQWWWDTFFHIYIFCILGEGELAKRNFSSLFEMQEEDGFNGHMVYWNRLLPKDLSNILQAKPKFVRIRPYMSAIIQPTLAASSLEKIYECTKDKEYLKEMLPKLKKYFEWLVKNRDFDGSGLLTIITPFESGIDYKPSFDEVVGFKGVANWRLFLKFTKIDFLNFFDKYDISRIRERDHFCVREVTFNTFYAWDLLALSRLLKMVGDEDGSKYEKRAKKVTNSMLEVMYDEKSEAFLDVYGKNNKKLRVLTPSIFFPIVLPGVDEEISNSIIRRHLVDNNEFDLPFSLPSVSKSDPSFFPYESRYIWRGPVWFLYNWFIYRCLKEKGFEKEAKKILDSSVALLERGGFREYYNPFTGSGHGAENFTWGGLVLDMMKNS